MRYYTKPDPHKSVSQTESEDKSDNKASAKIVRVKDAGKNYRKEEGFLSPLTFIVIISGGEKRERDYFKFILDKDRFKRIKLEFIADPKLLNPDGLLEIAKYKQGHYKASQENDPDKIYILSDVDHFYNELLKIKSECIEFGIQLIISNPCFEIWLYYGKFADKPKDFDIPENHLQRSAHFKKYLGDKVAGGVDPRLAILDIDTARKNAQNNYQEDENGIPKLYSTNMYILAESIISFIEEELSVLKKQRDQKALSYKNKSQSI